MQPVMYSVCDALVGHRGWIRAGETVCYYRSLYSSGEDSDADESKFRKRVAHFMPGIPPPQAPQQLPMTNSLPPSEPLHAGSSLSRTPDSEQERRERELVLVIQHKLHNVNNFAIVILVGLLLVPAALAGYIPNEDDRPINMKVRCETSDSTIKDPIGYLVSAISPTLSILLFLVLSRLGFAQPAQPTQPANNQPQPALHDPSAREPLLTNTPQASPPSVIPLPAHAALPMLTLGGVHPHTP